MKVIGYITEENDKLYDVETIRKLAGTTRSKIHRELKKNKDSGHIKYKNHYLLLGINFIFDFRGYSVRKTTID
jgi:hypothetical protein